MVRCPAKVLSIRFEGALAPWEVPAFRGAMGRKVGPEHVLFHHHQPQGLRYAYPLIQYKSVKGQPGILCLGEGVEEIHHFFAHADWTLRIGERPLPLRIDRLDLKEVVLRMEAERQSYELRDWLPLHQQAYREYQALPDLPARAAYLQRKLTGHILSFAKGMGWHIDEDLDVRIHDLEALRPAKVKGVSMMRFGVRFSTPAVLPAGIGLGGKVSIGFGTVWPARGG
ncbi:MAG: hypothetical protein D6722_14325 [Bacteroidetes bacterium]|nr:MAG: hypothetical protein D6722_14325 [Bacteroidota bacterium]